jgi:hypothetical protein
MQQEPDMRQMHLPCGIAQDAARVGPGDGVGAFWLDSWAISAR